MKDDQLEHFLYASYNDPRIGPAHLSVYMALFYCLGEQCCKDPFAISTADIMKTAHIQGRSTYNRIMKELNQYGYIRYLPSKYRLKQSKVLLPPLLHGR